MNNTKIARLFFLLISLKSFCTENQSLLENNNDSVSGLTRCGFASPHDNYMFEYRSEENYNKNSCTRPLKKIVDFIFCENRDSCCIRNKIDPKLCGACYSGFGIVCGTLGTLFKIFSIGVA